MKKFILKNKMTIIICFVLLAFVLLSVFITEDNGFKSTMNNSVSKWAEDTKKEEYVVTVIAQTTCSHCVNYKPIMQEVKDEYGFNLYWIEANTLSTNDYNTLTSTYELTEYEGTPYTFITYNGEFVDYRPGAIDEDTLVDFLKDNNVIK